MLRTILLAGVFLFAAYILRLFSKVLDNFIARQIIPEEIRETEAEVSRIQEAAADSEHITGAEEYFDLFAEDFPANVFSGTAERITFATGKDKTAKDEAAAFGKAAYAYAKQEDDSTMTAMLDKFRLNRLNKRNKSELNRVQVGSAPPTQIRMHHYE